MGNSPVSFPQSNSLGTNLATSEQISTSIGFVLMLAWHYLILFSPAFGDITVEGQLNTDYLFERQLVLYLVLAATFYVMYLIDKRRKNRKEVIDDHSAHLVVNGVLSMLFGAAFILATYFGLPIYIRLITFGFLGVLQGCMMSFWARCLTLRYKRGDVLRFGLYMIFGGFLALLVCFLQWPAPLIGAILLPGMSSIFLYNNKKTDIAGAKLAAAQMDEDRHEYTLASKNAESISANTEAAEVANSPVNLSDTTDKDSIEAQQISIMDKRMILFAFVFSLTIGFLQGSLFVADVPILISDNSLILVGIVIAGIFLYILPEAVGTNLKVDMMHRISVILFVVGNVIIMWNQFGSVAAFLAQITLLAGFNLFDFGLFTYGMWGYRHKICGSLEADSTRPVVYCSMSAGLVVGFILLNNTEPTLIPLTLLIICGACIILVVVTTMVPFFKPAHQKDVETPAQANEEMPCGHDQCPIPVILSLSSFLAETTVVQNSDNTPNERKVSPWRNACMAIAKQYGLSPRETEIFMLVAKGRNADYIQKELVISTHTAKTHIANIYHKLAIHSAQELLDLVEEYRRSQD